MSNNEAVRRYRARLRGEDVPLLKPGPKTDNPSVKTGRSRAQRLYPEIGPCESCGAERAERHHRDGDTINNDPSNIAALCRKCHMETDGRLEKLIENRKKVPSSRYAGAHSHRKRKRGRFV